MQRRKFWECVYEKKIKIRYDITWNSFAWKEVKRCGTNDERKREKRGERALAEPHPKSWSSAGIGGPRLSSIIISTEQHWAKGPRNSLTLTALLRG